MKFREYLTETKMPKEQMDYFKEIVDEFLAGNKGYKFTTTEAFMKALEKYDYKALSVLFGDLNVTSITQFVQKYKNEIESVNESINWNKDWSSPEEKAIKAKFSKVVKVVRAQAQYGKTEILVKLIGKDWPTDAELIKLYDKRG